MLIKEILFGYYNTQCLYAVSKLNIADHLKSGSKSITELAKLTQSNPNKLYRLMRFMAALGIFDELSNQTFQLNDHSNYLLQDQPNNLTDFIELHAHCFYQTADALIDNIQSDQSSFEVKYGQHVGNYFKEHANIRKIYNNAMQGNSATISQKVITSYDFLPYQTIIDVGGGTGSLLTAILLKNKHANGINFDLPNLKETSEQYINHMQLTKRCQFMGGNFQEKVPDNADLYIMKAILHAQSDDNAINILQNCKKAMLKNSKILLIERVIQQGSTYLDACINDINMMNVTHGKVRSISEFTSLINRAGFTNINFIPLQDSMQIIEVA